jgi:hypothetical protein
MSVVYIIRQLHILLSLVKKLEPLSTSTPSSPLDSFQHYLNTVLSQLHSSLVLDFPLFHFILCMFCLFRRLSSYGTLGRLPSSIRKCIDFQVTHLPSSIDILLDKEREALTNTIPIIHSDAMVKSSSLLMQ